MIGSGQQLLVSVGIPTYNNPEGLHRTLTLITGQTYKKIEVIVSDNCSPGDKIQKLVQEFIKKDQRIRYYRQEENKGPLPNFRFVLEKATGDYFMWASDDDLWEPDFISELIGLLESTPSAVLSMCRSTKIDYNDVPLKLGPLYSTTTNMTRAERLRYFAQRDTSWLFYGLYRIETPRSASAILEDKRLLRCAGDVLFLRKCIDSGDLVFSEKLLFHKRQSPPDSSNNQDFTSFSEIWRMLFWHCRVAFFKCYHLGDLSLYQTVLVYLASIQGIRRLSFYRRIKKGPRTIGINLLRKARSVLKTAITYPHK